MKRSSERILTTHIGSLPRPKELWTHVNAKDRSQPYDQAELNGQFKKAVEEIVSKQIEVGIDIPSDSEFSKASFTNYVRERLSGLEGINTQGFAAPPSKFPGYEEALRTRESTWWPVLGPIAWTDVTELETDIANLKTALKDHKYEEAFSPRSLLVRYSSWYQPNTILPIENICMCSRMR